MEIAAVSVGGMKMSFFTGAMFVLLALVAFWGERRIPSNMIEIEAVVVDVEYVRFGNRFMSGYHSVLSYTIDGVEYETRDPTCSNVPKHNLGDRLHIYYHKDNPKIIEPKREGHVVNYIFCIVMAIVGLIILLGGIYNIFS